MMEINSVLHVGMPVPPLHRAFGSTMKNYRFVDFTKNRRGAFAQVIAECSQHSFDLIFLHIQNSGIIMPRHVEEIRALQPNAFIVNWTGDVRYPVPQWYFELGRVIDVTLFSNATDVQALRAAGVSADYLQIGFDQEIYKPHGPTIGCPEIVFMGNNYGTQFPLSGLRSEMIRRLREQYGSRFGVYGGNWQQSVGNLMNNPRHEAAVYRSCKIAINLSHFAYSRYSSDRMFRILGCEALCLSHEFPDNEEFEGVVYWKDIDDLISKINHYLSKDTAAGIVKSMGQQYAHSSCTWENRIEELKTILYELDTRNKECPENQNS